MTERKYDKPRIKMKRRIIGIGNKIIVKLGENSKTGINKKNTATSTNAKITVATAVTIGKKSLLIFRDFIIPPLLVKHDSPPEVPLPKI
jgi:hypothetical protein